MTKSHPGLRRAAGVTDAYRCPARCPLQAAPSAVENQIVRRNVLDTVATVLAAMVVAFLGVAGLRAGHWVWGGFMVAMAFLALSTVRRRRERIREQSRSD